MRFTAEQKQFLFDYVPGHHYCEIVEAFNAKFPETPINKETVHYFTRNNHIKTGFTGRFHAHDERRGGEIQKGEHRGPDTEFKKGRAPYNYLPVGSITIRVSRTGYKEKWIKVAEPKSWEKYGRYLWEQTNGPIPKGYAIFFRDGDQLNCELSNLRCAPASCTGMINKFPDNVRDYAITIGELKDSIRRRKNDD